MPWGYIPHAGDSPAPSDIGDPPVMAARTTPRLKESNRGDRGEGNQDGIPLMDHSCTWKLESQVGGVGVDLGKDSGHCLDYYKTYTCLSVQAKQAMRRAVHQEVPALSST